MVKNVNILYKWLKMSIFYTNSLKCQYSIQAVKNVNISYKWLKLSIFHKSG